MKRSVQKFNILLSCIGLLLLGSCGIDPLDIKKNADKIISTAGKDYLETKRVETGNPYNFEEWELCAMDSREGIGYILKYSNPSSKKKKQAVVDSVLVLATYRECDRDKLDDYAFCKVSVYPFDVVRVLTDSIAREKGVAVEDLSDFIDDHIRDFSRVCPEYPYRVFRFDREELVADEYDPVTVDMVSDMHYVEIAPGLGGFMWSVFLNVSVWGKNIFGGWSILVAIVLLVFALFLLFKGIGKVSEKCKEASSADGFVILFNWWKIITYLADLVIAGFIALKHYRPWSQIDGFYWVATDIMAYVVVAQLMIVAILFVIHLVRGDIASAFVNIFIAVLVFLASCFAGEVIAYVVKLVFWFTVIVSLPVLAVGAVQGVSAGAFSAGALVSSAGESIKGRTSTSDKFYGDDGNVYRKDPFSNNWKKE